MPPAHEPDDDMAGGLRAAFADAHSPRPSVLCVLQARTGTRLDLHLHAADEATDVPVKIDDEAKALRDPTGRYQVLGEIGRGGVGVVYKGRDQDLGRDVAMKVLREEHAGNPDVVARFVEEAQIGGQLQHPGIVPVYELGLQHGERPYFAMKLVKGDTLASLLAGRTDPADDRGRLLGIFEQVCQTVAYAHARRVVHRDLKPANVMLGSFGEVQVVDWGFAKVLPRREVEREPKPRASAVASVIHTVRSDPERGSHSLAGSMLGTPAYMPPEQALGDVEHMDQRSDVFGLGAILCEILTGEPPYREQDGDLVQQAARAELQGAFERLVESGADVTLVAFCRQCLAPARKARPESAKQVAEAIGTYLSSVEDRAREAQIHAAEAKVRARSTILLASAAVLLLALGGGGYLYVQHESQARRQQAGQRVAAALNEANVRLGEARAAGIVDLALWTRAFDAAALAVRLADDADVAVEQRDLVRSLHAVVRGEQDRAQAEAARIAKDEAMRQRLLEVRSPVDEVQGDGFWLRELQRRGQAYGAAFADYLDGRELASMSVDEATSALAGSMRLELAAALDDWVGGRRYVASRRAIEPADEAMTARLVEIAAALDPDPWRKRLRQAHAQPKLERSTILALHLDADLHSLSLMSLLLLGDVLWRGGALDEASAVLRTACERFPADFGCVFTAAELHSFRKEWAEAVECFRIARALRPDIREARHGLGIACEQLGDHAAGERLFRALIADEPANGHWQVHLGRLFAREGKLDEAIACHQSALQLDATDAQAHNELGIALRKQGRLDEAIASLRRATDLDPRSDHAHDELGIALREKGLPGEAIASHRRALELEDRRSEYHNNIGAVLVDEGEDEEAEQHFLLAIQLDPADPTAHINLGILFQQQGRLDEALASLEEASQLAPGNPDIQRTRGIALRGQGKFEEAVAVLGRAIELDSSRADLHIDLGAALADQSRLDEAIACFQRALELDPRMPLAHLNLGIALAKAGRLDEALASYARAMELVPPLGEGRLRPEVIGAHINLGSELANQGRQDEGVAILRRAVQIHPEFAQGHFKLGVALLAQGKKDEALACFQRAVDLDGGHVDARFYIGLVQQNEGQLEEAAATYLHVIDLAPNHAPARNNLGNVLWDLGRLSEGLASLRQAEALWSEQKDAFAVEWHGRVKESIDQLESQLARVDELVALARGERASDDPNDFVAAALLVYERKEYALCARTYERGFAAFPDLLRTNPHRYNAACGAALAGVGQGEDAKLGAEERAALRLQAIAWLTSELARWREDLAAGGASADETARFLARALVDSDFDGVRSETALQALPPAEADAWRSLWQDIRAAAPAERPGR